MFQVRELRAHMARKGITQKRLAKLLGLSERVLVTKMQTGRFWVSEAERIMEILEISDPMPIFFAK